MKAGAWLIGIEGERCFIARRAGEELDIERFPADPADWSATAEQVAAQLAERGYRGETVCLALPSHWVLTAPVDSDNLPRGGPRQAMVYRLEEQLPLDAEDLTANFLWPVAGRCLGLAIKTGPVAELIEALGDHDIDITAICPTALLALWALRSSDRQLGDYVAVASDGAVDIFRVVDGQPIAWSTADPSETDDLVRLIHADLLTNPIEHDAARVHVVGGAMDFTERLRRDDSFTVKTLDDDPLQLAASAAEDLIDGTSDCADMRHSDLAPPNRWGRVAGLLKATAALATIFGVLICGAMLLRAARYSAIADNCYAKMSVVYRDLYPNTRVPAGVRKRLQARWDQLAGVSGSDRDVPDRPNGLDTLRDLVAALPAETRLRITELRLGAGGVFWAGEVRKFADAELIAQHLRNAGFDAAPPRSERKAAGGVGFTLTCSAERIAATAAAAATPEGTP
jgi:hypothetical protein